MAVSKGRKKVSQHGKKVNSQSSQQLVIGIRKVASYLTPRQRGQSVKPPKGRRSFGKFWYTVQSPIEFVSFAKKKDAVAFQRLLRRSRQEYQSDIVKHEITGEGFFVE